ncbi:MAG: DsbE family thiol:disulfide interchange protein [Caulobacteraceae bacterium]|nr:DsbE family thiol:disulfide interchange protein [Caulobacteraceae bacterium]
MKRWLAIVPLAVLAALAALFAARLHKGADPHYTPDALVGKPLPDSILPPLAGGAPVRLRGQAPPATLVNFFASWCGPCIEEAPTLMALKAQGVRIVGVAWKDDPARTKALLGQVGDPYQTVLVDRDGKAGLDFGVSGVPETFLVGADGKILAKEAVPLTPDSAERLLEKGDGAR